MRLRVWPLVREKRSMMSRTSGFGTGAFTPSMCTPKQSGGRN